MDNWKEYALAEDTRSPRFISYPKNAEQIQELISECLKRDLRICMRSGGHHWYHPERVVNANGLLIDLRNLNLIDVDCVSKTAWVGTGVTTTQLMEELKRYNLFFPVGHCHKVGMGGYLMCGGLGWNSWFLGAACYSIIGVEFVDAVCEIRQVIIKEENDHQDVEMVDGSDEEIIWLLRGCGPCFPAVVTRFKLRVYDHAPFIKKRSIKFSSDHIDDICDIIESDWGVFPRGFEPNLQIECSGINVFIIVNVTTFEDEKNVEMIFKKFDDCFPKDRISDSGVYDTDLETETTTISNFFDLGVIHESRIQALPAVKSLKEHLHSICTYLLSYPQPNCEKYILTESTFGRPVNRNFERRIGIWPNSSNIILAIWCVMAGSEDTPKIEEWMNDFCDTVGYDRLQSSESNVLKFKYEHFFDEKDRLKVRKLIQRMDPQNTFVNAWNIR